MKHTEEQNRKALKGKRILVVEDDATLAKRIAELFKDFTCEDAVVLHSMDAAKTAVQENNAPFHLVVMDVMLPANERNYKAICEHEKKLDELTQRIMQINSAPATSEENFELTEARQRRAQVLSAIQKLIVKNGGIQLVNIWRTNGPENLRLVPILFLTAIGNEKDVADGLKAAGGIGSWLVKPVASEEIIERSIRLLNQVQTRT